MRLVFDLETDNLYWGVSKIHCLTIYDIKADTVHLFDPQTRPIEEGIRMLQNAEAIIGHNIIDYDIPVIKKLYPGWETKAEIIDTMVIARATFPDIKAIDYGLFRKGILPGQLIGRHSLESWGYRLGELKGTYGKRQDAWAFWTPEMSEYCIQDVKVTYKLYERLKRNRLSAECFELEHQVATIISQQQEDLTLISTEIWCIT